jgi:hypothetical protein
MSVRLTFFFSALVVLAAAHIAALELYLYWTFPWFDIPMHFLGGVTFALGYSILPLFRAGLWPARFEGMRWYLATVLLVGIAWEFFEYFGGISLTTESSFALDTMLDLVMDLCGGFLGYYIVRSTRTLS